MHNWIDQNIDEEGDAKDNLKKLVYFMWNTETNLEMKPIKSEDIEKILDEFEKFYPQIKKFHGFD